MPSYASRVKAAEKRLERPLSTKEKAKLRKTGPAIAIKKSLHKKNGSYGGKNTKKNIEADAANQDAASKRDNAEVDKLLEDDRKK